VLPLNILCSSKLHTKKEVFGMEDVLLRMIDEREAAKRLGVSVAALRRWRRERRGPNFTRVERCIRYDIRSLEKFLAENTVGVATPAS
jgi:hypothetical protein